MKIFTPVAPAFSVHLSCPQSSPCPRKTRQHAPRTAAIVTEISRIEPRTLGGFRDYLPEMMIPREWLIDTARRVYRSYGFSPIDTPALEYLEILTGKGSDETDKQLYHFVDNGGRSVGLRFDLTVPLARFSAQHIGQLGTPFKRYHIGTVWRGEKPQDGRYREFMQCDFDTIGTLSLTADIETALVIHDLFHALGIDDFAIHINNRLVLSGLLELLRPGRSDYGYPPRGGQADQNRPREGGRRNGRRRRRPRGRPASSQPGRTARVERSHPRTARPAFRRQCQRRKKELPNCPSCSRPSRPRRAPRTPAHSPAIARGLDYYTGTIYETFLDRLPAIGSVCSGGRYDNLAKLYTNQELPGIGALLGLDRLLAALEKLGRVQKVTTPAEVFLAYFDRSRLHDYLQLAAKIRAAGIGLEFYPDPKKLGVQLKYASQRGFRLALIVGENEFAAGECQVKVLASGEKLTVSMGDGAATLIETIRSQLAIPHLPPSGEAATG